MIYITGDIHGETLRIASMIERCQITTNDTIVILGDVGMNYYGNKHGDRRRKKKLNSHGIKILCIHGNHEMRPETLITYREGQWNGGIVYVKEEFPNLLFAKDGEVYDLEGCKAIAIGGAYSVDNGIVCNVTFIGFQMNSLLMKSKQEWRRGLMSWGGRWMSC